MQSPLISAKHTLGPSNRGYDILRSGIAFPSSLIFCFDATQGSSSGVVPDLVSGATLNYAGGNIGFDSTGRMTGINYAQNPPLITNSGINFTINNDDLILFMCCGLVVDSHLPIIRKDPAVGGLFGNDPYAVTIGEGGTTIAVNEVDQAAPYVIPGDPGAIGFVDGLSGVAYKYSRNTATVINGVTNVANNAQGPFTIQLGPSSTAEAFTALMRWPIGTAPSVDLVKNCIRWMWREWGEGNYTIAPELWM